MCKNSLLKECKTIKIKEILDKYNVQYGDVFYSKSTNEHYMIAIEPELYGNPYIINLENGYAIICSWDKNGEEAMLNFFENSDVELVDEYKIVRKIKEKNHEK